VSDAQVHIPAALGLTRRIALGAGLIGGLAGMAPAQASVAAPSATEGMCRITPQATQGPYWIDPKLERSDITENRKGVPLQLSIKVVDAATCRPFERARVDIWHCDAQGVYSAFDGQPGVGSTVGQTFLRGHVFTGADGVALFSTIYPGWYRGRTPHIHVKVFLDDGGAENLLTCQLFFPDALSEFLFANAPDYVRNETRDTLNRFDGIAQGQGYANFGAISEQADHYAMTVILGVDRTARNIEPAMGAGGPGGPPPSDGRGPPSGGFGGPPTESSLTPEQRIAALVPQKA
jgi:protocatechuate 3,4-dioxygenase beta subunit